MAFRPLRLPNSFTQLQHKHHGKVKIPYDSCILINNNRCSNVIVGVAAVVIASSFFYYILNQNHCLNYS